METPEIVRISEFPVQSTTRERLAAHLLQAIEQNRKATLFFANTNFIVNCRFILDQKPDASIIVVNDGVGMDIAAKLVCGRRFEQNLNGTDFTPFLFSQARHPLKIFMLGGKPEVLAKAVKYAGEQLRQTVVGGCDGYGGLRNTSNLARQINATKPQVVLVALGNPVQERWILDNRDALDAAVVIGVGALFDFWSGGKPRAPKVVRWLRLEWFYRLCLEPRRLMRRYTWDIFIFLRHCFKYR